MFSKTRQDDDADLRCSFCNKTRDQVRKLVAGPSSVFICDECVQVCQDILDDDNRWETKRREAQAPTKSAGITDTYVGPVSAPCALCGMPAPPAALLHVPERGGLCPGCIGEIEAALASRARDSDS